MRDPRVKPRCRGCHAETSKKKKECQNKFEDPRRNPFQKFRKGVKKEGGGPPFPRMRDPRVKPRCRSCHAGTSKKKARQNKFEDPRPNPFQNFRVANFLCHILLAKCMESGYNTLKANKACERSEEKRGATFFQEYEISESSPDAGAVTRERAKRRRHVKISLKTLVLILPKISRRQLFVSLLTG
ncbi:hypothetical protein CDAR_123921 [Caerostris darwini]|uniref:Uncharacterized protein n=1 Tax=Caerostris darwini TaxID=1538125 RepID=A0AAV4W0U5_9ARAC|nr:hypothetical protein CDAR_123921 [Caerostris darwini]